MQTRQTFLLGTVVAIVLSGALGAAIAPIPSGRSVPGKDEPPLEEVRRLTERFRDVNVALAEGYIRDPSDTCETAAMIGRPASLGAMGIHYFRPGPARHHRSAVSARHWQRHAHGFSEAEHPHL